MVNRKTGFTIQDSDSGFRTQTQDSPFTISHSPFTIHHSPFTIHHSPFTNLCLLPPALLHSLA